MPDLRVFVSSRFVDLEEFREKVREVLRQLGVSDVAMEHLGARDERPLAECLRLVTEESDLFVGLYAHRYGFIPTDAEVSITEAEYEAAADLTRLIYLVDEDTPWRPKHIDRGETSDKLDDFKRRLRSTHICKTFSTPHELAAFVAADVGRELLRNQLPSTERSQREERVLLEAKSISGQFAGASSYNDAESSGAVGHFWRLYYGDLVGVENRDVEAAMVRVGEALKDWEQHRTRPSGLNDHCLKLSAAIEAQLASVAAGSAVS